MITKSTIMFADPETSRSEQDTFQDLVSLAIVLYMSTTVCMLL